MNLSEKLKKLRKENKITQEELARIIGVERSTVGKYETGTTPSMEILALIADHFNVTVDYLLGRDTEFPKKENPSEQLEGIDETSIEILNVCADLSAEAKEKVLSYIRFLKQDEENKQNP